MATKPPTSVSTIGGLHHVMELSRFFPKNGHVARSQRAALARGVAVGCRGHMHPLRPSRKKKPGAFSDDMKTHGKPTENYWKTYRVMGKYWKIIH